MKDQENTGRKAAESSFYKRFLHKAEDYLNKPNRLKDLLNDAYKKASEQKDLGTLAGEVWESFQQLYRMIKAAVSGEYQGIEKKTLIGGIAVLIYLLSPIDLIPDFIPMLGLLDDAALLAWFLTGIKTELEHFTAWEASQPKTAATGGADDHGANTNDTSDQRPKYGDRMEDTNATGLRTDRTSQDTPGSPVRGQGHISPAESVGVADSAGGGEKLLIKDFSAMDPPAPEDQPSSPGTAPTGAGEPQVRANTTDSTRLPNSNDSDTTSGGNVR